MAADPGPAGDGASPAPPRLALHALAKRFADRAAVDGLTLAVAPGEIYGLIGPNGSGKTTTVKLATGLYRPTAGRVLLDGIDLAAEPERAKRRLGYVPDEPFVYERMSGREFLHLMGELWAVERGERERRIAELAGRFRLEPILDGHAQHYSRGNRQKLALLAALLHRPSLLVIDEPLVGLDPESILRVRDLLADFAARGGGVLLCTHTLPFAEVACHRLGLLADGRLVAEGDLDALRARAGLPGASLETLYLHLAGAG